MRNRHRNPYYLDYYQPPRRRGFGRRHYPQAPRRRTPIGLIVAVLIVLIAALAGQSTAEDPPADPLPTTEDLYYPSNGPDTFDTTPTDAVDSSRYHGPTAALDQPATAAADTAETERLAEITAGADRCLVDR